MEEKEGNLHLMFTPLKKGDSIPELHFYLNWKCVGCEAKYGTEPDYCHVCRCNKFVQIEPEYQRA